MAYDNTNRASIWQNKRKAKDTDPDFTGTYTDEHGAEFWVSAWKRREGDNPQGPALKMSMRRKEPMQAAAAPAYQPPAGQPAAGQPAAQGQPAPVVDEFDEQIPF